MNESIGSVTFVNHITLNIYQTSRLQRRREKKKKRYIGRLEEKPYDASLC